jgi:acetyl-CoA synthetase
VQSVSRRSREDAVPKPAVRIEELIDRFSADDACPARLLCDDHPADTVAFTVVESDLTARDLTYGELRERSARLAASLAEHGVGPGDAIATLMGTSAELVVSVLAIWRRGAVHVPLFTAFAPAAIAMRLEGSDARMLIVVADQRSKLDPSADMPADAAWRVVTVGDDRRDGDLSFDELIAGPAPAVEPAVTGPAAPFILRRQRVAELAETGAN